VKVDVTDGDFKWEGMPNYKYKWNISLADLGCRMQQRIKINFLKVLFNSKFWEM
jgi:hypothetical protein